MVCALVLGLQPWGGAAESTTAIKAEIKTAAFHANELAQMGNAMRAVQQHAQHTLNCLEGPKGMYFKAAVGYPCQGQGNGVIPDLQAAAASGVPGARDALDNATTAWKLLLQVQSQTDIDQAQPWLKVVARYLQQAYDALVM